MGRRQQDQRKVPAQVVEDEEYQLRHERVAGIDVAKADAMVCTRLPPDRAGGRRVSKTEKVGATVLAVLALAGRLLDDGVELVVLESTSDYWRLWYYALEAAGLSVRLVNSSHARQLAGRPKTDRLDAQWLARLAEMGLLRPSFAPPAEIRALRDWARARLHLVQDRTRQWQRLEKLLEGTLVKLSSQVSSLRTASARDMIEAMIAGERDPRTIADLARGPMRGKRGQIARSLEGMMFGAHHGEFARIHLDHITFLDRRVREIDDAIAACLDAIPASRGAGAGPDAAVLSAADRLAEIPGVSPALAMAIAETGLDMGVFPTSAHLVSWDGLAPVARQSGPRARKPKKGQGNTYLRGHCTQAANGAARTQTFLGERLRRLAKRLGGARARVAVARSILVIIWHLLKNPEARFADLGPGHHARKTDRDRRARGLIRHLESLGLDVTVTPRAA